MVIKKTQLCGLAIMLLLLLVGISCKKAPVDVPPEKTPSDGSISGTLKVPTVFSNRNADPNVADYYITGVLNVESVLKIDSGVFIEMGAGASIVVKTTGTIIARGDTANPITITGRTKARGSWKYIMINSNDPRNELGNVNIEYGGGDNSNNGTIYLNTGGFLNVHNSKISNSKNNAIVAAADDANLGNFTNNQFENNEHPLQIRPSQIPQINNNNVFLNNDSSFITIIGSDIKEPLTWSKKPLPFIHKGITTVSADVNITEGVHIKMDYASMIQVTPTGSLNATGTASDKIVISSVDTIQGYWHCLLYQSRSNNNNLSYVDISYGGGSPTYMGSIYVGTSVSFPQAILRMNNCSISKSASWGIYVQPNASLVNAGGNTFSNNVMGNIGP